MDDTNTDRMIKRPNPYLPSYPVIPFTIPSWGVVSFNMPYISILSRSMISIFMHPLKKPLL